jgi:hypothetical protein
LSVERELDFEKLDGLRSLMPGRAMLAQARCARRASQEACATEHRPTDSLIPSIETFCARRMPPSEILAVMLVPASGLGTHAKISLDVFLRLTAMDACCGPPALL